jgi:hypothetical protein
MRSKTGRVCPFDHCGKSIPATMFACRKHWFSLSRKQQDHIWEAYRAYLGRGISLETLRAHQAEVLQEAHGNVAQRQEKSVRQQAAARASQQTELTQESPAGRAAQSDFDETTWRS